MEHIIGSVSKKLMYMVWNSTIQQHHHKKFDARCRTECFLQITLTAIITVYPPKIF